MPGSTLNWPLHAKLGPGASDHALPDRKRSRLGAWRLAPRSRRWPLGLQSKWSVSLPRFHRRSRHWPSFGEFWRSPMSCTPGGSGAAGSAEPPPLPAQVTAPHLAADASVASGSSSTLRLQEVVI